VTYKTSRLKRCFSASFLTLFVLSSTALSQQATTVGPAVTLTPTEQRLVDNLKVETIKEVVNTLSSDEMEGRGTAQPGGDKAAAYIADRFQKLGLKPLGEKNSYYQPIEFRERQFQPETSIRVGQETLAMGPDFFLIPPYTGDKSVGGELVFVAYGLTIPNPRRNDLAGVDVNGKAVVLLEGPPKLVSKESWKKVRAQFEVIQNLIKRGAAAIIIVNQEDKEHPYSEMSDYLTRRRVELSSEDEYPTFLPPFISISDRGAEKLFAGSGTTFAAARERADQDGFAPMSLKNNASINIRMKKSKGVSSNVVALLEGSDPVLKAEAVVYSAHYDAFGKAMDNRIYHGAADNGLGVAEMLAVAETMSQMDPKPKRSIIFLAVTGEEYGLYGSSYWVSHPTWKVKQVAADLNLDGMGTEVYGPVKQLVGYGAEHSTLGSLLNEVATANGLKVIPDPMPEEKSFYRSDHYGFVKRGVPALTWMGVPGGDSKTWIDRLKEWEKTDYHQPSDVVKPNWNWDGPRMVAAIGLVMGLRVATTATMPSWLPQSVFNRERGTDKPAPPEP
jgi:hypothetical protein